MATDGSSSNNGNQATLPNETVTPFNTENPSQTLININVSNVSKLTATTYIPWSVQIRALLQGYNLAGFLEPDAAPPATITANNAVTANPAYEAWFRQDRLIFAALLGSLSTSCQALITMSSTSAHAWNTLATTYGRSSRGHVKQIKEQLRRFSKGTKTIDEYMNFFKVKADELALLGKPMDHEDLIDLTLAGLGDEYKAVKDVIQAKDTTISFIELHEKLLNHEVDVLASQSTHSEVPITANAATHKPRQSGRQNNRQQYDPRLPKTFNNGPRGYQGKCQLCGVHGHSAKFCRLLRGSPGILPNPSYGFSQHHPSPTVNAAA
ncbi:PREDICTED: uncharacterized protein LOC104815444, partial [Tarenaya hassleriana]